METWGLFNVKSTYQTDYVKHKIQRSEKRASILYDPLEHLPRQRSEPKQIDFETLQPYSKDIYVPFDLYFRERNYSLPNRHQIAPPPESDKKLFEEKLKVRKTRPRVYLIPQICLDDIPEDVMYGKDGLAEQIYTSDWKQFSDITQGIMKCKYPSEITNQEPEKEDIVALQKKMIDTRFAPFTMCERMEPGLQKYARDWDNFQSRAIIDKDKAFWERNMDKGLCAICEGLEADVTLPEETKAEIKNALKDDLMRNPYTLFPPGYEGYKPQTPVGIDIRRKLFRKYEPYVSSLMLMQEMYLKSEIKEK